MLSLSFHANENSIHLFTTTHHISFYKLPVCIYWQLRFFHSGLKPDHLIGSMVLVLHKIYYSEINTERKSIRLTIPLENASRFMSIPRLGHKRKLSFYCRFSLQNYTQIVFTSILSLSASTHIVYIPLIWLYPTIIDPLRSFTQSFDSWFSNLYN